MRGSSAVAPAIAAVLTRAPCAVAKCRKGFFEHEPFIPVRQALPEEIQPVLTFSYYTGCRKGEILALQKDMRDQYWPEGPRIFSRLGKPIEDFRNAWDKAQNRGLASGTGYSTWALRLFHQR